MSLNKAMLIGNVGRDPEVRYLEQNSQNPTKVATFTLATTERFKDRSGQLREQTEWHNIVCWRNNADVAEKFIKTGTQLYIEGRLRSRSWDGQDGQKHYTTEIVADTLQLLGKRQDNPGAQPAGQAYGSPAVSANGSAPAAPQYTVAAQPAGSAYSQPAPAYAPSAGAAAAQPAVEEPVFTPVFGPAENPDDDLPF